MYKLISFVRMSIISSFYACGRWSVVNLHPSFIRCLVVYQTDLERQETRKDEEEVHFYLALYGPVVNSTWKFKDVVKPYLPLAM